MAAKAEPISLRPQSGARVKPDSLWRMALRRYRRHRMAMLGFFMLIGIMLYVVVGSFIFTENYANFNDTTQRLRPPSAAHPFGTDSIGRDVLARTIYGGQISLIIGVLAMLVSITMGTLIGALAGYFGGLLDAVLMRITEAIVSIPLILILLLMAKVLGGRLADIELFGRTFSGSVIVIVTIVGITSWTTLARIVRASFLSLKEMEFVTAARALGVPNWRIIAGHILPNTIAPIMVAATLGVAGAILQEAYISFFGLGVQAPTASWGNMLNGANQYLQSAPWLWFYPGLLLVFTVMSINFVGDGLRDALDPRGDKKL
ncbi:MAG: ABC transporter permease [Chloroflexi bacterium]|nr:ABC transporter permease [Chloroflexota bacterium]